MEVTVNGTHSGTWLVLEHEGTLFAPRAAFDDWRIPLNPAAPSITFKGQTYSSLAAVPGYRSTVNFADQSLELLFSPEAFSRSHIGSTRSLVPEVGAAIPSVFLNYDLNYQRVESRLSDAQQDLGMLTEIGYSSAWGVLTSSALGRNLGNNMSQGTSERTLVRLETAFARDFADRNTSLVLGDTGTRASMTASGVYFGGIRYGSNYALTPSFVSHPGPALSGVSALPSTVSLYVDGVLRQTSNVPTGPFTIDNSPLLMGGGEARLVVRDLLGRETVVTRSFLSSNKLLASGLDDWSVEAGRLRLDLGIASASYGPGFVRGIWRHGHGDDSTWEGSLQSTSVQHTLGLGVVAVVTEQWLGSAALVASHTDALGDGTQWLLGLERQGLRSSLYMQAQGASSRFRNLGEAREFEPIQLQVVASATYASERWGAVGVGITSTVAFDGQRFHTLTLNYSILVGERGSLNLIASQTQGEVHGSSIGLNWVLPLDKGRMVSASATRTASQNAFDASVMQSPTPDDNLGWRLRLGQQQNSLQSEGGLNFLGSHGNLNADVSASPDQHAVRLSGNGALVLTDGHLFATQRQNDSFALAAVPGYTGVGIGLGNHILARTDSSGVALIPQLVPYQRNGVRLDPQDLPVSAEIDSIELIAVPARRSVVKVVFPVRSGRAALLKIQLADGAAAPAGAIVQIEGDTREFYVARRGEAFVTGLQALNHLRLTWQAQQCTFQVALPPESPTQIARVGPLACIGMER
jgi:outer membrane usher protein